MGKRSNFDRKDKDFYVTPYKGIVPLAPHLPSFFTYIDPCYGTGAVPDALDTLVRGSVCVGVYDISPCKGYPEESTIRNARINKYDTAGEYFITNPPWQRQEKNEHGKIKPSIEQPLHMIIDNLAGQKPTWLLFDSDWAYTKQARPYLKYCVKIVAVGRLSWMGNDVSGVDNCSWYLFDKNHPGPTEFIGR